jgi:hypothetical protein
MRLQKLDLRFTDTNIHSKHFVIIVYSPDTSYELRTRLTVSIFVVVEFASHSASGLCRSGPRTYLTSADGDDVGNGHRFPPAF